MRVVVRSSTGVSYFSDSSKAGLDEVLGLRAVGRLQHRDLGELGVVAVVLLVLRAVQGRVVGGDQHQAALDARVRGGEERVGGHVDAHVFHGTPARVRRRWTRPMPTSRATFSLGDHSLYTPS